MPTHARHWKQSQRFHPSLEFVWRRCPYAGPRRAYNVGGDVDKTKFRRDRLRRLFSNKWIQIKDWIDPALLAQTAPRVEDRGQGWYVVHYRGDHLRARGLDQVEKAIESFTGSRDTQVVHVAAGEVAQSQGAGTAAPLALASSGVQETAGPVATSTETPEAARSRVAQETARIAQAAQGEAERREVRAAAERDRQEDEAEAERERLARVAQAAQEEADQAERNRVASEQAELDAEAERVRVADEAAAETARIAEEERLAQWARADGETARAAQEAETARIAQEATDAAAAKSVAEIVKEPDTSETPETPEAQTGETTPAESPSADPVPAETTEVPVEETPTPAAAEVIETELSPEDQLAARRAQRAAPPELDAADPGEPVTTTEPDEPVAT